MCDGDGCGIPDADCELSITIYKNYCGNWDVCGNDVHILSEGTDDNSNQF